MEMGRAETGRCTRKEHCSITTGNAAFPLSGTRRLKKRATYERPFNNKKEKEG